MVEKFNFSVSSIALLFLINASINVVLTPRIGKLISIIGDRKALIFEYYGLVIIFLHMLLSRTLVSLPDYM
jgi:hypothetical protein